MLFRSRMVYLYYILCLRYTILVGNPRSAGPGSNPAVPMWIFLGAAHTSVFKSVLWCFPLGIPGWIPKQCLQIGAQVFPPWEFPGGSQTSVFKSVLWCFPVGIPGWNPHQCLQIMPWCFRVVCFVCWLLIVPATCECISGTDLHRQFYVLPH